MGIKTTMASHHFPKSSKTKRPRKRPSSDSESSDSEYERIKATSEEFWPRFLVITGTDKEKPVSAINPFALNKCLQGIAGTLASVKKLRDGDLLVECNKKAQALNLLATTTMMNVPVKVSQHGSLNSSQGVIRTPDLANLSEKEIKDGFADQGVTHVKRCKVKRNGNLVPTNTYFLTFSTTKLPSIVYAGCFAIRVTAFVPTPLRCFRCQKFGHGSRNCKGAPTCRDCGKPSHENSCESALCCVNCKGNHSSSSKECPKFKIETEIQKVRTTSKCSFQEAKQRVTNSLPNASVQSYSTVVSKNLTSANASVQPDLLAKLISTVEKLVERLEKLEKRLEGSISPSQQNLKISPHPSAGLSKEPSKVGSSSLSNASVNVSESSTVASISKASVIAPKSQVVVSKASGGASNPQSIASKASGGASNSQSISSKASGGASNSQMISAKASGGALNPQLGSSKVSGDASDPKKPPVPPKPPPAVVVNDIRGGDWKVATRRAGKMRPDLKRSEPAPKPSDKHFEALVVQEEDMEDIV